MGRIQVNIKATPDGNSINGIVAKYLKQKFGENYGAAYLEAAQILWASIALKELGADDAKVKAATEKSTLQWRTHWSNYDESEQEDEPTGEEFSELEDEEDY